MIVHVQHVLYIQCISMLSEVVSTCLLCHSAAAALLQYKLAYSSLLISRSPSNAEPS